MNFTGPRYRVRVVTVLPSQAIPGLLTHAVKSCPRCGANIGINAGMFVGMESIICNGIREGGTRCGGHFYLRTNDHGEDVLDFVGTV